MCWERRCLLPFCLRREQRAPGTALVPSAVCGGLRAAGRSHRVAGVELPGFFAFSGAALAVLAAVFALVMTGLNIACVLFQDCWTFPKSFVNYEEYRRTTSFLLPTPGSAVRCVRTWQGGAEQ